MGSGKHSEIMETQQVRELIRLIGAQKTVEHGDKFYQAIVGVGYPIIGNRRILCRKWRTKSEALKYMIDFFCEWIRLHPEVKPRAKKVARFS
jgi:hypothetical protein